jgi:type IV secretion system protein VirD4
METANYIAGAVGTSTVSYTAVSRSGREGILGLENKSVSTHHSPRALLTRDEVKTLPKDESVLIQAGSLPTKVKKILYYRDPAFMPLLVSAPELQVGPYKYGPPRKANDWFGSPHFTSLAPLDLLSPNGDSTVDPF